MIYNPERIWNIALTNITIPDDNGHWLYLKVPVEEGVTTSELFVDEGHIDPLRDDGCVIYKWGYIHPVADGKREVSMLLGNTKGGSGASAYVYIAYASAADGTGFTLIPNSALNYTAILATNVMKSPPVLADFAGLWYYRKGNPGDDGYTPQKGTDYYDGNDGHTPYILGGNWYINGVNTGVATTGQNGKNTEMSVQAGYVYWRLVGDANWTQLLPISSLKGADGKGISTITLTSTVGKVKTYTITFTDITTTTFSVADGNDGANSIIPGPAGKGISSVVLTNTVGKVKTYTITFTDATTFNFDITDGTDGAGGSGGSDTTHELIIDFEDLIAFTYPIVYTSIKFTSQESEHGNASLSIPINTTMAKNARLTITPTAVGWIKLIGEKIS